MEQARLPDPRLAHHADNLPVARLGPFPGLRQLPEFVPAADKAREFYTKYPTNVNAAEAKKREYDLLKVAVDLGKTNSLARLEALETERLKDTSLPEDQRIEIRVQQIQRLMSSATPQSISNSLPKVEKAVRSLQADFPDHADLASLTMSLAEAWLDVGNLEKSRALAEKTCTTKSM